jgi:Domain of unknown function DUF83.
LIDEELTIKGIEISYYIVCKRKLWLRAVQKGPPYIVLPSLLFLSCRAIAWHPQEKRGDPSADAWGNKKEAQEAVGRLTQKHF